MHVSFSMKKMSFKNFFKRDRHFSIDTPHNKYILLQHGNIFENYVFAEGKNTLKGLKNNT